MSWGGTEKGIFLIAISITFSVQLIQKNQCTMIYQSCVKKYHLFTSQANMQTNKNYLFSNDKNNHT